MSGAADLMPRIDGARDRHQAAKDQLSEVRGMLGKPEEQAPKPEEEGGGWLDKLKGASHTILDVAGFIPVVGTVADLANAGLYAAEGDYAMAALSSAAAIPLVGDAAAAARLGIKGVNAATDAARAADNATDAARLINNAAADATNRTRNFVGGHTSAAKRGQEAHREFAERVKSKPGWRSEPQDLIDPKTGRKVNLIDPKTGRKVRPDALDPSGHPVELKPNTPSGRRAGRRQIKAYERATGKIGRVIYYDP